MGNTPCSKEFEKKIAASVKQQPKLFWSYVQSKTRIKSEICDLTYFEDNIKLSATTDKRKAEVLACCCCCCCCRPHSTNVLPAESSTRNHVAASSLSPQVARKGSTLSGFVQMSRLERAVGRDLHSNKWEEV